MKRSLKFLRCCSTLQSSPCVSHDLHVVPCVPDALSVCCSVERLSFIAKQRASAPRILRIVPHAVPRVGRSYKHFPDGFELHLLTVSRFLGAAYLAARAVRARRGRASEAPRQRRRGGRGRGHGGRRPDGSGANPDNSFWTKQRFADVPGTFFWDALVLTLDSTV